MDAARNCSNNPRLQQQLPIIHDHIGASLPHAANGRFEARVLV
jgi:hypothetical protein